MTRIKIIHTKKNFSERKSLNARISRKTAIRIFIDGQRQIVNIHNPLMIYEHFHPKMKFFTDCHVVDQLHLLQWSRTIFATLVEGQPGNISVKLF